ncbi:FmdB family zinc ribbon protein [Chloroflexota bacterium]
MLFYDYRCGDCSTIFEVKCSYNDQPIVYCPTYQGKSQILFTAVPIIFKGPGFYTTDSRKNISTTEEPVDAPKDTPKEPVATES